ncbi:hypothetical protein EP331_14005 [bacterium]|nr:MAG: hypothetical protein EP331_14005 [bacterium]
MKRFSVFWCLYLIVFIHLGINTKADDLSHYRATVWTSKNGLPQNSISGLMQSKDGYLWFTTLEGLVRFDGRNFKVYNSKTMPGKFSYDRMTAFTEDENGVIWATTEEGGLYSISKDNVSYKKISEGLSSRYGTALLAISNGILIGTTGGVLKQEDGVLTPWHDNTIGGKHISKIEERKDGTIWIATSTGLYRTDKSTGKLVLEPFTNNKRVYDFEFLDDRTVVIILNEELYVLEERTFRKLFPPKELKVPFRLLKDHDNSIWIGTGGYGIWNWKGLDFRNVNTELGIKQDVIWSLFADEEQNIWIGTNGGGVIKLTKGPFSMVTGRDNLSHPIVWSLSEAPDRSIWSATYFGINQMYGNKVNNYYLDGVSSQFLWTVLATKDHVYAGSNVDGLFELKKGSKKFTKVQDLPKKVSIVRLLKEDDNGTIWVGSVNGLYKKEKNGWVEFPLPKEKREVKTWYQENKNLFWIGTKHGIAKIEQEIIQPDPFPDFPDVAVRYITSYGPNRWIFSTEGLGLIFYVNAKQYRMDISNGLNSNFVSSAVMLDSMIWVSTNSGISSFNKKHIQRLMDDPGYLVPVRIYDELDGMETAETNGGVYPNIIVDEFGKIWYPTMNGIAVLDTKKALQESHLDPRIFVDELRIDGSIAPIQDPIKLKNEHKELFVRFSVIQFAQPERLLFAYRLSSKQDWVPLGDMPIVSLNQVATGNQELEFSVWNKEGRILSTKTVSITKEPHYTESAWFILLMISIGIGMGFVLYKIRILQLKRSEERLNAQILERTEALEEEKEKSEKALLKLAKINEQLKAANKMKNDFLSIAAHDLKNPLNGIMGFSELLLDEFEQDQRLKQMASYIQKNSEKMLDMIERLLEQGKMNEELMNMKMENTDISEIAWTAAAEFFPIAKKKMQKISLSMGDQTIIQADAFWLRECIDNLISNALKYSPIGTIIHVRTLRENHEIILEVQDSGPGIAPEDRIKIFEPYKRLDHKTTGGETSTGLGLSIVKRVMDQHHGKIEVDSEIGVGSTFRLIFQADEVGAELV